MDASKVYNLWEDGIGSMADDLGEKARTLIDLRGNGDLPDAQHDQKILTRALFVGSHIRQRHLDAIREKASKRMDEVDRKVAIRTFFEAVGGTVLLARKLNTTPNALRVNQSRAKLPKSQKFEMMEIAREAGHDLEEELFEAY